MTKMIKTLLSMMLLLLLLATAVHAEAGLTVTCTDGVGQTVLDPAKLVEARSAAWAAYSEAQKNDETLLRETEARAMTFGDATMRYTLQVIGEKPENGYPLYIAMHGGGSDETPDLNDSQWAMMGAYYSDELTCGVYVAVRGVRDTWDCHFNPESYPLYDRLIRYMILTQDVDPNRVYLEGFSAGGDGVWGITPRMPDRFAAANMSSGHPNGIRLINLYRMPIQLQAGEFDTAFDRHTVTAEYGLKLDELQAQYGGFEHRTLIHYDCGHNYADYGREPIPVMADVRAWLENGSREHVDVDCFPPDYMDAFTRDPLPKDVMWDLSTRADSRETDTFYYLKAPYSTCQGLIRAGYDPEENRVTIETQDVTGEFSILLNEQMVDFTQPVLLTLNGREMTVSPVPVQEILDETTADRGDPCCQFEAMITVRPE